MELFLEQIELADNTTNDNDFDIFYDVNTKLIHAFENTDYSPREFVYRLKGEEDAIAKEHRQEILEYCLAALPVYNILTDEVGLGDIFLHGKYIERIK